MPPAVYPGSLDPITFGHIAAITDAAEAFGEVIVALGINPEKNYLFSLAEREELARKATAHIPGVSVTSFEGLLVHYLVRHNLKIVVRGLRNGQDFDDALLQDTLGWQQNLADGIKALYVPARAGQRFISSTGLKAVIKNQGSAQTLTPLSVIHATQARMLGQYMYGVTGPSGSGKSHTCTQFAKIAAKRHIPLTHVDLDKLTHEILAGAEEPLYVKARQRIIATFGPTVAGKGRDTINRKALGQIVFGDTAKLAELNAILHDPIFFKLNDRIQGKKGVFLVDAALLAESGRTHIVHNNVLLLETPDDVRAKRLCERDGLNDEQVQRRIASQFTTKAKANLVKKSIETNGHGTLRTFAAHKGASTEDAFEHMLQSIDVFGELRLSSLFAQLGVAEPDAAYQALRKLYAGNNRHFHTLARVVEGLSQMHDIYDKIENPAAFQLAWAFHGAGVAALESFSRQWQVAEKTSQAAQSLLQATVPTTPDALLLHDLLRVYLSAKPDVYTQSEKALRKEHPQVSHAEWKAQRKAVLELLLKQPYLTAEFQSRYAKQAQINMKNQLQFFDKK